MSNITEATTVESDYVQKSKVSSTSKTSKLSSSHFSQHGSMFGRSVAKFPRKNDPGLVHTLSVVNSRIISTIFNPTLQFNSTWPDLRTIEGTTCIRELGKSLNIVDYEFNYISFWVLDELSKMIKDLQIKDIKLFYQNTFMAWFRFVLRKIAVSAYSREHVFDILQNLLESAVNIIMEGKPIPDPKEIEIINTNQAPKNISTERQSTHSSHLSEKRNLSSSRKKPSFNISSSVNQSVSSKSSRNVSKGSNASSINIVGSLISEDQINKNLERFRTIVEMIYKIFADRFVYTVIHKAFSSTLTLTPVDIGVVYQDPKQLKPPLVAEPIVKAASPKKSQSPRKKSKEKGKKKKLTSEDRKGKRTNLNNEKENKVTSKGKSKTRKEGKNELESKRKSKTSTPSQGDKKKSRGASVEDELRSGMCSPLLEERKKLFHRDVIKEYELELKNGKSKNQFILPLSDAVDINYVTNIIKTIMPQDLMPIDNVECNKLKTQDEKKKNKKEKGKKLKKK